MGVVVGVRVAITGINLPKGTLHTIAKENDLQTDAGSRRAVNTVGRSNVKRVFSRTESGLILDTNDC